MLAAPRPIGAAAADRRLRRELGATLALGWPIILANLAINAMTATDFMMLGRLSPEALAAGSLGFFLYQPPFLLGLGVVARAVSDRRRQDRRGLEPRRAAARDASGPHVRGLVRRRRVGGSDRRDAVPASRSASRRRSRATRAFILRGFSGVSRQACCTSPARSVFSALERPRPVLLAGLVAVAFNALANYALIFGKLGMPALGIIGSGLATTLSQTLMFALLVAASLIDPRMRPLQAFRLAVAPRAAASSRRSGGSACRSAR